MAGRGERKSVCRSEKYRIDFGSSLFGVLKPQKELEESRK